MIKIVVAEDEHLIRKWLLTALDFQELNMEIVGVAEDGEEAVDLIKKMQPDIVLTDINMPKKNAFELFEETKEIEYRKIILSGYDEFNNAKKAMQYGVIDFLVKPINIVELRTCLVNVSYSIQKENRPTNFVPMTQFDVLKDVRYSRDQVVTQVLAWIKDHYAEKFTIAELAQELNYSESYIYQKVKKHIEMTLNEYVNRYRIKMAVNYLIKKPHLLVYEVAELVGFNDYKYFNQVFKKFVGMSVTEFKEKIL